MAVPFPSDSVVISHSISCDLERIPGAGTESFESRKRLVISTGLFAALETSNVDGQS